MKYLKTPDELLFESLINESVVYYSPNLRDILNKISSKSEIAKLLSELEGTDPNVDFTLIDWGSEGYLSFMQMPKALKLIKDVWPNTNDANIDKEIDTSTTDTLYRNDVNNYKFTGVWKGQQRNQIKIGKLINKLLPNKFSAQEIEDFVNQLKSLQGWQGDFDLVSGDKINHWYKSTNYESLNGSLGSSCMKDSENLKLYFRNPEVCQLLILKRFDKLAGRALVWKLHDSNIPDKPQYFMDRVYTTKDSDYKLFYDEAEKRGWSQRLSTRTSDYDAVKYKDKEYLKISMTVKVKRGDYKVYPYLDTFKTYNPNTGILSNKESYSGGQIGDILLTSTQGSFTTTRNDQGFFRRLGSNIQTRLNPPPVVEELNIVDTIKNVYSSFKYKDTFSDEEYMKILENIQINNLVKVSIVRDEKDRNKKIEIFFGSQTRSSLSPQYLLITKLDGEYKIIGHIEVHQFAEEDNRPTLKKYKTIDEVISECKRRLLIMLIATYIVKKFGNIETLHDIRWNRISISEDEYQEAESLINDYSVYSKGKVNFQRLKLLVSEELGEESFQKDNSDLRKKPIYSEIESDVKKLFK